MTKLYSFSFVAFIVVSTTLFGQEAKNDCIPIRDIAPSQLSFQGGEKLTFVANYSWGVIRTEVGELTTMVTYKEDEKEPYFYAQASVKTYPFFDKFLKIRDSYEGRFRACNLTPIYFYRDIHEGRYTIENRFHFLEDYKIDAQIVRSNNRIKDTLIQGRSCTFDIISLFYFARNMDVSQMRIGESVPLSFVIDEEAYDLTLRYLGVENKKVSGVGTFRCLKFAATLVAGVVFTGKEEMLIWVSDDANRLPIWLESPVVLGKASARIAKYEGLRFPVLSKIK